MMKPVVFIVCIIGIISVSELYGVQVPAGYVAINTVQDFLRIATDMAQGQTRKKYILMQDISISQYNWVSFGERTRKQKKLLIFNGVFDGNGHTIFGLTIVNSTLSYVGLFAILGVDARVQNVVLDMVKINVTAGLTASVAGLNMGQILHVSISNADIQAKNIVGGIVGRNVGDISNSTFEGTISGDSFLGGIAGYNSGNIVQGQVVINMIGIVRSIGGIAGVNAVSGVVSAAMVNGTMQGGIELGALVGDNSGVVSGNALVDKNLTLIGYDTGSITGQLLNSTTANKNTQLWWYYQITPSVDAHEWWTQYN